MNSTAPAPGDSAHTQRRTASALLAAVGVGSAFLATGCCVGPLLLAAAGLGGAGVLVRMEPYRPLLAVVSAAFIVAAGVATRRRPARAICACSPADARRTRAGRYMTFAAAVLAIALIAAPYVLARWAA